MGCEWVPGVSWGAAPSHSRAVVQVGLQVPTPLVVRRQLALQRVSSLAQEFARTGS